MSYYTEALSLFKEQYHKRHNQVTLKHEQINEEKSTYKIVATEIKPGNEPTLLLHNKPTNQVIILVHGLSDSPYYVSAIAEHFFELGANVIIPLLPAHGLVHPDKPMEDARMDAKWREEMDAMVVIATLIGSVISLGGFSAGGALCYNKILRDPVMITGGLFLFAAAIDVGLIGELGQIKFISSIAKIADGEIEGHGMDPYKYPKLPLFSALELGQIINQNEELSKRKRIHTPVFAAHAIDDKTAKLSAVRKLVRKHAHHGILYVLSNDMAHAELPLQKDVELDTNYEEGKPAHANPDFGLMMNSCISFYKKHVLKLSDAIV